MASRPQSSSTFRPAAAQLEVQARPYHSTWAQLLGIDLRSLALFRIGLGVLLLADLATRSIDLHAHYTDWGALPRSLVAQYSPYPSLHLIHGSAAFQALLFLIAGIFAFSLLIGYRTGIATIVSWLLLISLHARNHMILTNGDVVLRMLLFWGMFLPLGACYSVDRALDASQEPPPTHVFSVATAALLLQVAWVYLFSIVFKADPVWRAEGSAVYYALSYETYSTPLAKLLLGFPLALRLLTFGTLALEAFGPLLAFVPFFFGPLRTGLVASFIVFHLGLGLCLALGLFPYVCMVAWLVFLPAWFWDKLARRAATPARQGVKIYYDGDCEFCKKMALLISTFLGLPRSTLRPAQQERSIFDAMQARNSWVVSDYQGKRYFRFEAFAYLCCITPILKRFCSLLQWPALSNMGNRLYDQIATRRSTLGEATAFLRYRPLQLRPSAALQPIVGFFFLYVLLWNLRTTNYAVYGRLFPDSLNWIEEVFKVDQRWNMFAPPPKEDGWYVIPGVLKDGTQVDLMQNGKSLTWRKPHLISATYSSDHWTKYFENLGDTRHSVHRPEYSRYLCRKWNGEHGRYKQLQSLKIYFMREHNSLEARSPKPEKILLHSHSCS